LRLPGFGSVGGVNGRGRVAGQINSGRGFPTPPFLMAMATILEFKSLFLVKVFRKIMAPSLPALTGVVRVETRDGFASSFS